MLFDSGLVFWGSLEGFCRFDARCLGVDFEVVVAVGLSGGW